jgi:hypothetical protein
LDYTENSGAQETNMIDARTGQSLTTGSLEAAEQYQLAVDRILGSETGAAEALDRALALDSNLALALAARYLLAKDAKSADADVFKERARMAAEDALPWERAQYADVAELLKLVSVDQRIGVGGSRVERVLIDLLEARAVELAA